MSVNCRQIARIRGRAVLSPGANPKRAVESRARPLFRRRAGVLSPRRCRRSSPQAGRLELAMESNGKLREALTFDDVLLRPGLSELMPSDADIRTRITREIPLNIPIIASAMDTVTEAKMAIAMAQAGGLGVIHRNLEPEEQAAQVRQVKKFESGMVVNPATIHPQGTLPQARTLMKEHGISGIPVVERAAGPSSINVSPSAPG